MPTGPDHDQLSPWFQKIQSIPITQNYFLIRFLSHGIIPIDHIVEDDHIRMTSDEIALDPCCPNRRTFDIMIGSRQSNPVLAPFLWILGIGAKKFNQPLISDQVPFDLCQEIHRHLPGSFQDQDPNIRIFNDSKNRITYRNESALEMTTGNKN